MKKHNIAIVKMLRENATPMNKSDLLAWLAVELINTDISATVDRCVDKRCFAAHEIELSDNHGASRKITVPVLSDCFTFEDAGIYSKYGIISPKARFRNKNMYVIAHENGYILVSYDTMICFYNFKQNTVYFKRNAFDHSVTTSTHIHAFLTHFVNIRNAKAIKMFAK